MQVNEFIQVLNFIEKAIQENGLIEHYQELNQILDKLRSSPSPEASLEFTEKRKQLIQIQRQIEPMNWTYTKHQLFNDYGANQLIGNLAANNLKNIFLKHQADPYSSQQEIQAIINQLTELLRKVSSLKTSLGPLSEKYELESDVETLQLVFTDKASINDLTDLEKYSHQWRLILHNFSRLVNESPAPAEIQSIQKGSTVLVISAPIATILAIAFVVEKIIQLYEKLLHLRKLTLEIQSLKLNNKKLIKELGASEKQQIEEQIAEAVEELYLKYEKQIQGNDKQEIKNQLNTSAKNVYNFVVNGGRVEVNNYEQEGDDESSPNLQFEPRYNQIKERIQAVGNIELIEAPKGSNENSVSKLDK